MMRAAMVMALMLVGVGAQAGEPLQFVVPDGWTVDAEQAKAMHVTFYAVDQRADPIAQVVGASMNKSMPPPDDAFVEGFIAGARRQAPTLVEVRHDFVDINGVRALRVVGDVTVNGATQRQASYVMPAGDATAVLVGSATRETFDKRLGEFDQIARATRGLAPSTDTDPAFLLGVIVGRILGTLAVFVGLFFLVRFVIRRLNKAQG